MTEQIKETAKIVVGAAFAIFAIWQITVPVDEALVTQLIDIIFAILGTIIGGPAVVRMAMSKKLVDK